METLRFTMENTRRRFRKMKNHLLVGIQILLAQVVWNSVHTMKETAFLLYQYEYGKWDANYAVIDRGSESPGYLTAKPAA